VPKAVILIPRELKVWLLLGLFGIKIFIILEAKIRFLNGLGGITTIRKI
jgi:hypothetical protein